MLTLTCKSLPLSLPKPTSIHKTTTLLKCSLSTTPTPATTPPPFLLERGLLFETGNSFFRHESFTGRDLGVLSAALYKRTNPTLRILDAMCGCGVRSLRYLAEAKADFLLANDGNDEYRRVIMNNLAQIPRENRRWVVTHFDANRVLTECYLQKDYFDFIDVDSFGSDSSFLRNAFSALRINGLVYLTSTDGYSAGGHRPPNALASYGAYIRPMPYANELGLRMLIGGAVREASVLGFCVTPLFSYYSYHGPVFRVLLRLGRGKLDMRHYGFISYCHKCGNSQSYTWDLIGKIGCSCSDKKYLLFTSGPLPSGPGFLLHVIHVFCPKTACGHKSKGHSSSSPVVSGPLWIGPLHDASYLTNMVGLAEEWGWIGNGTGEDLEKLIKLMVDESDPRLPVGYIKFDEIAKRAKVNSPPLRTMISALQKEGFAASRSHIAPNAIKTDCPMTTCVKIMRELVDP